jgi:ABC-2 type transport system ATP-binding protein
VTAVLEATDLGKRYRHKWALSDCTLSIPQGHVVGLVGPNGSGKSTLLNLAAGLLSPSAGRLDVLGGTPARDATALGRVGFVAQDPPVYSAFSVHDHLRFGAHLNPHWDAELAKHRVEDLGLDPSQRAGKLSGGQRAQLALTLAIAKRPELLLLDEPVASLDPLARRGFLRILMETVADQEVSIVLSSHLVSDIERVCDYLIVLSDSRVQVAGEVDDLVGSHHRLIGARCDPDGYPANQEVIDASHTGRQSSFIVRSHGPVLEEAWTIEPVSLEDLVLAYMARGKHLHSGHYAHGEVTE